MTRPRTALVIPEPRFSFPPRTVAVMHDREWLVDERLHTGQWQLTCLADRERLFLHDREIAQLMAAEQFRLHVTSPKFAGSPTPLSPLVIGSAVVFENRRKHAYVKACLTEAEGSRSRRRLGPVIARCAVERGEAPPAFTTVLNWMSAMERNGPTYGTAALSNRHDLKGTRGSRLPEFLDRAIAVGVDAWVQQRSMDKGYAVACKELDRIDCEEGHLIDRASLASRFLNPNGSLANPKRRTFERRCAELDRFTRDWALKGPAYAKQHGRTWQTTKLADRPYEEVEVDHHTLDILIVDEGGLVLGRPDLVVLRDRATAMIAGMSIGFDAPSYPSFLQALRHAMYPKDPVQGAGIKNPWPCFGRIETLFVDGGMHFLSDNIQSAGLELGFKVAVCPPRMPWMKGALERFFETLNMGLVHSLPGTTMSNVVERKDYEHLAPATLTLPEFERLLTVWICDDYHAGFRKALGPIRGIGDRPLDVWAEKAARFTTPVLPPRAMFTALAGDVAFRTIQRDGIQWDNIRYESPDLWPLLNHPAHKRRSDGVATRYKIVRDPYDLGSITVIDPHAQRPVQIPATLAHEDYASGLTLHQHNVIMANARARKKKFDMSDLLASKAELAEIAMAILRHPGRRKIERAVARYIGAEVLRRRSHIATGVTGDSGGGFLSFDGQAAQFETPSFEPIHDGLRHYSDDPDDDLADLQARVSFKSRVERDGDSL
jgi:putative transposase